MKRSILLQAKLIKWFIVSIIFICSRVEIFAETNPPSRNETTFTVKTYDGLELPAQVIKASQTPKKLLLFIMGGTPCDEKGNMGGSWDANCNSISEPYQFYRRFIRGMPTKGYTVATMAKRNFVYPCNIPRPSLDDFALDIQFFIAELKKRKLLQNKDDLVLVGHSEGTIVATKVLGLLKNQPVVCVLLGSGSLAFNFSTQTLQDWYMVDHMRRVSGLEDEEIQRIFKLFKKINDELPTIDEETFENSGKRTPTPLISLPGSRTTALENSIYMILFQICWHQMSPF